MKHLASIILCLFIFILVTQGQPLEIKRPKVGLVLSGGGAKGFAHIGVLKVLEEAGMPIDFIGGTSMGSIIGSLYALGYSADSLQKLVETQDWPYLLTDRIERKYLSFEEKEFDGKYFIPFPVNEGKLHLPSAVVSGQNLELLLSRLMVEAQASDTFTNFPIPFLCIATDLGAGKAVVFKNGWPTTAVKASMAIPTIFNPVIINGQTFVDGGVFNNFPVNELKEMGADIIIGVDVGFEPFQGQELNSMLRIIEQSLFTHTISQNTERRNACNILIRPDLKNYNMMSFDHTDSIIFQGELASRAIFGSLKHLADSLNAIGGIPKPSKKHHASHLNINNIKIEGFHKIPRSYILSKTNLIAPSIISVDEIEEAVKRIYGTLLFRNVSYRINSGLEGNVLIIEVQERPQSIFSLGVNYNTEYKASIYFNTSFYNVLMKGSKLGINALLGENPRVNANYFIFSGWNPSGKSPIRGGWRFDFGFNLGTCNYRLFDYFNGQKIASNRFTDLTLDLYTQTVFRNSYAWGVGMINEFSSKKPDINPFINVGTNSKLLLFHSYLKFDTHNRSYFPSEGIKLDFKARYLTNLYDNSNLPGIMVSGNYNITNPISKKLTFITNLSIGISICDSLPETYRYKIGGLSTYYAKNTFPFVGLKSLEVVSDQFILASFATQLEVFPKHFIIAKANAYNTSGIIIELFTEDKIQDGYSLGYGYNSIVGPMEITFMSSSKHEFLFYLNMGFWF